MSYSMRDLEQPPHDRRSSTTISASLSASDLHHPAHDISPPIALEDGEHGDLQLKGPRPSCSSDDPTMRNKRVSLCSSTPLVKPSGPDAMTPNPMSLFKRVSPRTISDATLGLSDGLTVPFALTAGLAALGSSRIVVFGGLAELTAGSISMGLGGYLGAKAELEGCRNQVESCQTLVRRYPAHAVQVLRDSLSDTGVDTSDLERSLRLSDSSEDDAAEVVATAAGMGSPLGQANGQAADEADADASSDLTAYAPLAPQRSTGSGAGPRYDEARLVQLLLRYVHNQSEEAVVRPVASGVTIGTAYFCGGFVPLLPYLFVPRVGQALWWSVGVMVLALIAFGAVKTTLLRSECDATADDWEGEREERWATRKKHLMACLKGAVEMVLLGGLAAGAAMGLVYLFDRFDGLGLPEGL